MWSILRMAVMSLVAVVTPGTGKIPKNGPIVFERGEHLLQNRVSHSVFRFSQSSEIALERI